MDIASGTLKDYPSINRPKEEKIEVHSPTGVGCFAAALQGRVGLKKVSKKKM